MTFLTGRRPAVERRATEIGRAAGRRTTGSESETRTHDLRIMSPPLWPAELSRCGPGSVQPEIPGHRVDAVVVVGADGQAGSGGGAAEFGQAAIGDEVDYYAGF